MASCMPGSSGPNTPMRSKPSSSPASSSTRTELRIASSHMKLARKMLSSPVSSTVLGNEVMVTSGVPWSPAMQVTASPNQANAAVAKTCSSSVSARHVACMSERRLAMSVP